MIRHHSDTITTACVCIMLSIAPFASAEPITQEMAQRAAQAFLLKEQLAPPRAATAVKGEFVVRDHAAGLTLSETHPVTDANGLVLAFVHELRPAGFIITSADDIIRPILGFSFSSPWDAENAADNPLLDFVKVDVSSRARLQLAHIDADSLHLTQANRADWAAIHDSRYAYDMPSFDIARSATEWGPWLQTRWNQDEHWNNRCPYVVPNDPDSKRLTGCVATAMAQIINYWQHPRSVAFSDDEFIYISGTRQSLNASSVYGVPSLSTLRAAMSSLLYNGHNDEEAFLSFASGVKLHMDYGLRQSGANTYNVRNVLNNHFDFGSARAHSSRNGVWNEHRADIIDDITNGHPVQIAIHTAGESGGHSVVVDGYREENEFFWVNMGWGGSSNAWYNVPSIRNYDVVHTVVYNIARYQGWNQIGADPRNSYHAIYPAPITEPVRKWEVNVPGGLPISYRYGHLVVGTGGRTYASLNPNILGDNYHPYIDIFDKFGSSEKLIEIQQSNTAIAYLCQNSRGEVFFGSDQGGPTATNSKLFRLDPRTDQIVDILTHSSPDSGIFEQPIKVDRDDYLYFVIQPRLAANYAKLYAVSRTGQKKWTEKSFSSLAQFYRTVPAIDEDRDRVYLNYFEKTESTNGRSRLIAFRRSNGSPVFDIILPNIPTHAASAMAGPPAVAQDGTVYIGAYTSLYAYSPNGVKLWEQSFHPAFTYRTPAIGNDGTLYVNYGKYVSGTFRPGFVRALNPSNGNTKWELALSLESSDNMGEIYAAANGMVVYAYSKGGVNRLGGVKDNGASYGGTWDMQGGGVLAFGPGRTIYSIPPWREQAIWALSDSGERGDPEGLGMDYADNSQPLSPSLPSPADGSDDQASSSVQLSWACSDPDGHGLKYDVFVCALVEDEEAAFVPIATQITGTSHELTGLLAGTRYLWTVVATDGQAIAEGPVWSFTTGSEVCMSDSDCPDDGKFCTGDPVCDADGVCGFAGSPCPAGQTCNETNDTCLTNSTHPADDAGYCGCDDTGCGDGRIELCEAIGFAAAWKRGDHGDMSAAIRGLYLWISGECYAWDSEMSEWMPEDCE